MWLWESLDPFLIALYRVAGEPVSGFFLGTFLLAAICTLLGEFTVVLVVRANASRWQRLSRQSIEWNRLSGQALSHGDEASYRACNKQANDAWGQLFFSRFGLTAASLWPLFLALGWLQFRFSEIEIPVPLLGAETDYLVVFLLSYVATRLIFRQLRPRIPLFHLARQNARADGLGEPPRTAKS
jgi:hypothetical protein